MANPAKTPAEYLAGLPEDRRKALQAVRKVIKANLDPAIKEGIQYGMLGYFLPHKVYPDGYHCDPKQPVPFASVASQKNHMGLYLFCIYTAENEKERFAAEWKKSGKKLDMGKSCVRFKKIEDVPLDVLGKAIKRMTAKKFIASYEEAFVSNSTTKKKATKKKAVAKKTATKKTAKKATKKKAVAKKAVTKKKATAKKASSKKTVAKKVAKKTTKKKAVGRSKKK